MQNTEIYSVFLNSHYICITYNEYKGSNFNFERCIQGWQFSDLRNVTVGRSEVQATFQISFGEQ